jgi:hypothetical protein
MQTSASDDNRKRSSKRASARLKNWLSCSQVCHHCCHAARLQGFVGQDDQPEGGVFAFCRLMILSTILSSELSTAALR